MGTANLLVFESEPRWYGRNAVGEPVTNGTYFYKLKIQNEEVTGTINVFTK